MGADCVKPNQKQSRNTHYQRMDTLQHDLRTRQENLHFTMTIEHLRLTNMTDKVNEVKFTLENQFEIRYSLSEFIIHENLIKVIFDQKKSQKIQKTQFEFPANRINSKKMIITLIGHKNETIDTLNLKLIHLCTGPIHHDHLLKELKGRLMFDLHLYQNINIVAKCKTFNISLNQTNSTHLEDLSYRFTLITDIDDRLFTTNQGYFVSGQTFQDLQLQLNISNNILKQAAFRIQLLKQSDNQFVQRSIHSIHQSPQQQANQFIQQQTKVIDSIFIPYGKIQNYQTCTSLHKNSINSIKKSIIFHQPLKQQQKIIGFVDFVLEIQSSILYVQPMQGLIFSQIGVSSVSPTIPLDSDNTLLKQIKEIYKNVKKMKFYSHKSDLVKDIDRIFGKFKKNQEIFSSQQQLYSRQIVLVKLLNELSQFFSQGEQLLNKRLWSIINYLVHKPQLSTRYLTLHQNQSTKKCLYLLYYKFICETLCKVIISTGKGITYQQLQCIQKFIAFSYFRFPFIQDKIMNSIKRKDDPIISEEKLIQLGASQTSRSPSKSYVYDWEINVYRKIQEEKQSQDNIHQLEKLSKQYQGWDKLLFNRDDQELFYGLYLEIWNQAQFTLKNLRGKILWEYFPNYGPLLSCFLGEMNNSRISDFSMQFKLCSNKLVLNQKLLNTFVVQLFPKTYLFELTGVLKCLSLLQSYFQVLTKQNKKLPHDFHFNFFYAGVKSIFEQNHSYLVVKTLLILYKYYDIFTMDFKKTLNSFLLSNVFYHLFLNWCYNVRKMFHHLLYFKILLKKVSNPEENHVQSFPFKKTYSQCKPKDIQLSQEMLITSRFNKFLRKIQNLGQQLQKQTKNDQSHKKQYFQNMKQKISQKRKKRQLQKQNQIQFNSSIDFNLSQQRQKPPEGIIRKKSLFLQSEELQYSRQRKMSVNDEIHFQKKIDSKYKRYCLISLKEYQDVKTVSNPNKEIQILSKLVQGDIDSY